MASWTPLRRCASSTTCSLAGCHCQVHGELLTYCECLKGMGCRQDHGEVQTLPQVSDPGQ